jgi:multiple sugar transport system substrate-binding protein
MLQSSSHQRVEQRSSLRRRDFLRNALGATALVASSGWMRAPAVIGGEKPHVTMLSWNNFVPEADVELRRQAEVYSKQTGVPVTVDFIAHLQLPTKTAAEVQGQSGHDIIFFLRAQEVALYENHLIDLTDFVAEFKDTHGGYYPWMPGYFEINGVWRAIPWFTGGGFLGSYNETIFKKFGIPPADSWEELKNAGKQLKQQGHPVGIAISHCVDANSTFWYIHWCYGGKVLEADGKTVAIKSDETKQVLEFYKELYMDAMEPDVLSWDDASNNRYLISGKGCWVHNPISAYNTAKTRNMPIAQDINHTLTPRGPAGRFMAASAQSLGIWKFSKQQEEAKKFIRYLFQPENFNQWMEAAAGYNIGPQQDFANHPVFSRDPKITVSPKNLQFGRPYGWPAKPGPVIGEIDVTYVLPDMVAKVVTDNTSIDAAMTWCEEQLAKIVKSQRT